MSDDIKKWETWLIGHGFGKVPYDMMVGPVWVTDDHRVTITPPHPDDYESDSDAAYWGVHVDDDKFITIGNLYTKNIEDMLKFLQICGYTRFNDSSNGNL